SPRPRSLRNDWSERTTCLGHFSCLAYRTRQSMSSRVRSRGGPLKRRRYSARRSTASSAAFGSTTFLSEPARKTAAWTTASRRGLTPSSGGMSGKTAAPDGTSPSASSAMSASGDRGDDAHFVAFFDGRSQVVEVANVFVVDVHVDKTADLPVLEDARGDGGKLPPQII